MLKDTSFEAWNLELCSTIRRSDTSPSLTDDELCELKKIYDMGQGPLAAALWLLQHRGETTRDKRFAMLRLFLDEQDDDAGLIRKPR